MKDFLKTCHRYNALVSIHTFNTNFNSILSPFAFTFAFAFLRRIFLLLGLVCLSISVCCFCIHLTAIKRLPTQSNHIGIVSKQSSFHVYVSELDTLYDYHIPHYTPSPKWSKSCFGYVYLCIGIKTHENNNKYYEYMHDTCLASLSSI